LSWLLKKENSNLINHIPQPNNHSVLKPISLIDDHPFNNNNNNVINEDDINKKNSLPKNNTNSTPNKLPIIQPQKSNKQNMSDFGKSPLTPINNKKTIQKQH
jgi:hypothetical protein